MPSCHRSLRAMREPTGSRRKPNSIECLAPEDADGGRSRAWPAVVRTHVLDRACWLSGVDRLAACLG
jgi:hypothetical protein